MIIIKIENNLYGVGTKDEGHDFEFESFNKAEDFLDKNGYRQSDIQPDFKNGIWHYEVKEE